MRTLIPPPILGLVIAIVMWVVARNSSGFELNFPGRRVMAAILLIAGIIIEIIAVRAFFKARTTVNPMAPAKASKLVISGLFQFSRNPMYLSLGIVLAGWALLLGAALNFLFLAFFVWYMNEFQIKPEEAALRDKFGEQYAEYCSKVRRWI